MFYLVNILNKSHFNIEALHLKQNKCRLISQNK